MHEGRKQPRTPDEFPVQLSAVRDPVLTELARVEKLSPKGVRLTDREALGIRLACRSGIR